MFNELKKCLDAVLDETRRFDASLVPESYRNVTTGLLAEFNGMYENAKQYYLQSTHPIAFQRYRSLSAVTQHRPIPQLVANFPENSRPIHFYYKPAIVHVAAIPVQEPKAPTIPNKALEEMKVNEKQLKFIPYTPTKKDELSSGEKRFLLKLHEITQSSATKPSFALVANALNRLETSIIDMYVDLYDRKILGVWPKFTHHGKNIVEQLQGTNKPVIREQTSTKKDYRMSLKHILN